MGEKVIKFDQEKIRPELIPATAIQALGEVLKVGAIKYSPRNWEEGLDWDRIFGAIERHLRAIKAGEDYDPDDGLLHVAHLLTNVVFLNHYYQSFPQGDRFNRIINPMYGKRIALDIDGVIADFNTPFAELINKNSKEDAMNWRYSYKMDKVLDSLGYDFWINIPTKIDAASLCFEPVCYITHRRPEEARAATSEWIEKHKFPCVPIHFVDDARDKGSFAKEHEIDIIVDDKFKNFYRLNEEGILCFLMDNPWNRKYEVGHLRVYHPNDIFKYRLKQ